ncbi:small G protein signaling modulator 3-like [Symsagittifera roscoffensis]|uniref:small G protein signaling modulator 3-like n=1 Tax=Symsagittifera roscoffensis TaxID=84072 RepID=UPI00307C626F
MPISTQQAAEAVKNADSASCFDMAKVLMPGQLVKSNIAPELIQGYYAKRGSSFEEEEEARNISKVYKSGRLDKDIGILVKPGESKSRPLLVQLGKPLGTFFPPSHGPFSALTPSMWPQDILSVLTQSEKYRMSPEFRYDEFGFREDREDDAEPNSNQLLSEPLNDDPNLVLRWVAHLEFTCNHDMGDLTWDKVDDILPKSEKLRMLVKEGIPHCMRPQIWSRLGGGRLKQVKSEISYVEIVKHSTDDNLISSRQIEKDLLRTLPNNALFSAMLSYGVPRLRRVLRALAWLYPEIGYCQGMGTIVATFLLFMEEEETFWMVAAIIEDIVPASYYTHSLLGVQADQKVLRHLVMNYLPEIDIHLKEYDIELSLITLHWFLTLFSGVLHMKVLLRVWDQLFYEGSVVLFQITLGLLKMNENEILEQDNTAQIFNLLSKLPEMITDVDKVLQIASKTAGSLTEVLIETQRRKQMAVVIEEHKSKGHELDTEGASKQVVSRRQMRRPKSMINLFFSSNDLESEKVKNIQQTEIITDLRDSVQQIARHFQATEKKYKTLSIVADYTLESHQKDHERYLKIARNRRRRAKALLDFERHDDDELGFKRNDIITIISMKDEHCWVGELNGVRGWFPAKFVELLDERSKQYTHAGDDSVTDTITDLVRGHLCPNLDKFFRHGMKQAMIGHECHPWLFVEEAAIKEVEKDFNSVYSRLVLCKTYRLDEDGKVLTPEELLYRSVQSINQTHDTVHVGMDAKFRSWVCLGLNEQVLHIWLEILASCETVTGKWFNRGAFMNSPGWVQIKCELRILCEFGFNLHVHTELPSKAAKDNMALKTITNAPGSKRSDSSTSSNKPMKEGVRDLLVKHHLFSWDL